MAEKSNTVTDILDRIRWPHVAIILGIIAGVVAILVLAPDTAIGHVIRAIGLLTGTGGVIGTGRSAGMLRESIPAPEPVEPRRMPPRRREGSVDVHFVMVVLSVVWAVLMTAPRLLQWFQRIGWIPVVVLALSGCASGAGFAASAVAVKPILDTTCAGARMACRAIDTACTYYEEATAPLETSGGEE